MKKIPTAEELGNKLYQPIGMSCNDFAIKLAIEFAKIHVEAALKAASKNAKIKSRKISYKASHGAEYDYITSIDKKAILTAYPETNIK
jgi:hypothetical protein